MYIGIFHLYLVNIKFVYNLLGEYKRVLHKYPYTFLCANHHTRGIQVNFEEKRMVKNFHISDWSKIGNHEK